MSFRVTNELSEAIENFYKDKFYPSPDNELRQIKFKSRSQFLEFICRAICRMDSGGWYLFSNIYNPFRRS